MFLLARSGCVVGVELPARSERWGCGACVACIGFLCKNGRLLGLWDRKSPDKEGVACNDGCCSPIRKVVLESHRCCLCFCVEQEDMFLC